MSYRPSEASGAYLFRYSRLPTVARYDENRQGKQKSVFVLCDSTRLYALCAVESSFLYDCINKLDFFIVLR